MKKKIMIFGAGLNQITMIQAAKRLGHESIVLDPNPEAPGKQFADYFYAVDAEDYETTKDIALRHKVDGIVTSQMQNPLRMMSKLADDINLPFMKPEILEQSLNKFQMKELFLNNHIACARGILLKKSDEITEKKLSGLKYPLIIKPLDSHSSRGVYKCESFKDITRYSNECSDYSTDGSVIIEEFIEGQEYSVESITFNGKTDVIQITEKLITPYPETVELRHIQPADLSKIEKMKIGAMIKKVISVLEIDNTASHAELKMTKDGPVMIEIGPRLGGGFISSYLTKSSCGVDMDEAAIQVALNFEPDLNKTANKHACVKYIALESDRKIKKIEDYSDLAKNNEELIFAYVFFKQDQIVPKLTHSGLRPAVIIVKADNRKELLDQVAFYEKEIKKRIILE